jgi:hypothetical protein
MLRQLREDDATRNMACVLVTAYDPDSLARFGPLPGDVATLRKPVDVHLLADVLRRIGFAPRTTVRSG